MFNCLRELERLSDWEREGAWVSEEWNKGGRGYWMTGTRGPAVNLTVGTLQPPWFDIINWYGRNAIVTHQYRLVAIEFRLYWVIVWYKGTSFGLTGLVHVPIIGQIDMYLPISYCIRRYKNHWFLLVYMCMPSKC